MGATNAMLAYRLYAGRVPATSMQLLAYMALVSKDDDVRPWYGQGYEALAVHALGRPAPAEEADLRAVERGMKPLLGVGAIVTERRAAARRDGPRTALYRLKLDAEVAQSIDGSQSVEASRRGRRPTKTVEDDPRKVTERPTKNGGTTHENRGTEEPRGTKRSEIKENHLDQEGESPTARDALAANHDSTPTDAHDPDCCPSCGVLLDPDGCNNRRCPSRSLTLAEIIPLRQPAMTA